MSKKTETEDLPVFTKVRCMVADWFDPGATEAKPLQPSVIYNLPEGAELERLINSNRVFRLEETP